MNGDLLLVRYRKIGPRGPHLESAQPIWLQLCGQLMLWSSIVIFVGCAATRDLLERSPFSSGLTDHIETNHFLVDKTDDVFGRLGVITSENSDTLPDIARHFSLGINAISAANPGVDLWVPRAGTEIELPLRFILPETPRRGIVINLAAMRLFYFEDDDDLQSVSTFPVGIGTSERPTPLGRMRIIRKKLKPTWHVPASIAADHLKRGDPLPARVPPGPLNPLGEHALYLNEPGYLIHGTNKPASIGLRATNGCIRLYPEDIKRLFETVPVQTPVTIVYQPYLIGRHGDMVYLEAHGPFEESDPAAMEKAYATLNEIQKRTGLALDWDRVKQIILEARGIPLSVSAMDPERGSNAMEAIRLKHPVKLSGLPQLPALRADAWYVLAADYREKDDARRLAAIINHQGPQIPARVLSSSGRHRVLAGPFLSEDEAGDAAKRMRIDLEIDGILVAPVEQDNETTEK